MEIKKELELAKEEQAIEARKQSTNVKIAQVVLTGKNV